MKLARLKIGLTLLLTMAGATALSLLVLMHQSLRLDEAQSLWQTSHSIGDTLRVVAQDVHVPLYHIILHYWQVFLGHGIVTVRLLSLIFFLATIPAVYVLGRQVLRVRWALFAAALFAFLPFMSWYSSEARMYTLLALMATLSQIYFLRIIQHRKGWLGYGITAVVGAYSHYFFSFNLATQGIYFLANRRQFPKRSFRRLLSVGLIVIVALAPWLWYFHSLGSGKNTSPNLPHPSTIDFFNAFSQFLFGFQTSHVNTIIVSCWPVVILLAFFAIKRGQRVSPEIGYLTTAAVVPVALAYILSFVVNPFFLSRYMISCVAPLVVLIVWFISNYGRRTARIAVAAIIIGVLVTSWQQDHSLATPVKENYQQAAADISARAKPQDVIVISAPFTVYPFEYYYHGSPQIKTLPDWNRQAAGAIPAFDAKTLPAQVTALSKNHQYIYLLLSEDQGYEETIRQYFLHHYPVQSVHTYSPDLTLYVFQVGYYTVPALGTPATIVHGDGTY